MSDTSSPSSNRPVAFVTGASRGIGEATTRQLVAAGYTVIAAARDLPALEAIAAELPGQVIPLKLDLTADTPLRPMIDELEATHGPIEVLVNNAGYGIRASIEESPLDEVRRMFEVNLVGLLGLTAAVLPGMRQRRRGRVIMVSSVSGQVAVPISGIYSATKFALRAVSDALRREVKWLGIHVVQIEPGPVATGFAANAASAADAVLNAPDTPYRRIYQHYLEKVKHVNSTAVSADAVAALIVRACRTRRPRYRYAIHWIARWLPTLTRWLPEWVIDRILAKSIAKAWRETP